MRKVRCKVVVLGPNAIMPVYQTEEAACADVALSCDIKIAPGKTVCPGLELGFEIPRGYKIVMYPRSSLLVRYGVVQPVSIIDSDYSCMEVHVPLFNGSGHIVEFKAGTRIAQIECVPVYDCSTWEHKTDQRTGGFGSTGE